LADARGGHDVGAALRDCHVVYKLAEAHRTLGWPADDASRREAIEQLIRLFEGRGDPLLSALLSPKKMRGLGPGIRAVTCRTV
jgi:hypothetical protein